MYSKSYDLLYKIGCLVPMELKVRIVPWFDRFKQREWREHKVSFGDLHPDKTFLVCRCPRGQAPMGHFINMLGQFKRAEAMGWLPVVDALNYPTRFTEIEPIKGTRNSFEYFAYQPGEYTLEEVYKSKNVILSTPARPIIQYSALANFTEANIREWDFNDCKEDVKDAYRIFKKYTVLRPEIKEYFKTAYSEKIPKNKKILGVFSRCETIRRLKAPGEYIEPSVDEIIEKVKDVMESEHYDLIFLVAQITEKAEQIQRAFPNKVITGIRDTFPDDIYSLAPKCWPDDIPGAKYNDVLKYLTDIYILSKCDGLIGGLSGASIMALIANNGKYEDVDMFYRGRYGSSPEEFKAMQAKIKELGLVRDTFNLR